MIYTIKEASELKPIIDELKLGKHETFSIYLGNRKVKYNFDTGVANILLNDDGVEQTNPYYVAPVVDTNVLDEVVTDEVQSEVSTDEVNVAIDVDEDLDDSTKVEEVDQVTIDELFENDSEEVTTTEVDDTQSAVLEELQNELSELRVTVDNLNSELSSKNEYILELESKLNCDNTPNTDELIDMLVDTGYKVTISK